MENKAHHEPRKLSYQFLKQITNDFDKDRILGSGGFGTVYKGIHENHEEIAVKVLHNISGLDDKEFHKEFNNLRGLKHPNIVELVGFCSESEEFPAVYEGKPVTAERLHLAICFEYVQNGSLNKLISDETTGFTWHTRYKIIKGICEGIKYLREGLDYPIMHFDLKPDNILLDKCMVPKIADFGLSKLFGEENTLKTMTSAGTRGYCPPEYIKHQIISRQFDIFSLGVIILRIMTGHERYNSVVEMSTRKSVKLVHESWRKRLRGTLSHTSLEVYCNQVKICIEIALDCLISNRQERPTIQDIVYRLNETEIVIGDRRVQNEQFYQEDGVSTFPSDNSNITINSGHSSEYFPAVEQKVMSFSLLKEMTDNFSEERLLGHDSYGRVYKGVHRDGQVIAVKMLHGRHKKDLFAQNRQEIGDKQLKNELRTLMKLCHQNLIQFIGYCQETGPAVIQYEERFVYAEITHNLLCFEYLPNGSLAEYISATDTVLDWCTLYGIIKGICEGMKYLHEGFKSPIIHDQPLNPLNILMDEKMVPKIFARFVGRGNTVYSTLLPEAFCKYMSPEFVYKGVITKEGDMYSLGVITLELMVGQKSYREFRQMPPEECIKLAHANWKERLQKTVHDVSVEGYCQQVKKCLEIAVKCLEHDSSKRPSIGDIVHMLDKTEILTPRRDSGQLISRYRPKHFSFDPEESELLLEVHPLELRFTPSLEVERKKKSGMMIPSSCSLQLKNKGNDRVAFMLVANCPRKFSTKSPLCDVVPPRSVYTLALTLMPPSEVESSRDSSVDFFTLYNVVLDEYDFLRDVDKDGRFIEYDNFFNKVKATGGEVQERKLKVICDGPADRGLSLFSFASTLFSSHGQPTRSTVEIITTPDAQQVSSIDVHPTEPWILTTSRLGSLGVRNYHTMETMTYFQVTIGPVQTAKFIAREKWIVAGNCNGGIHVYNYHKHKEVKRLYAHDSCITILVVHPTYPFVLSSSDDNGHDIKLWDWSKGWECTRTFHGHTDKVMQVTINPEDEDSFGSASLDGTVKVWRICSDEQNNSITLNLEYREIPMCVDYFTRRNRQHMIVGSKDNTVQILELGKQRCVDMLEGHVEHISVANVHPELSVLITGSLDGTIRIWNSTTYKLENIICFNLGAIYAVGFIKCSRRIVAGCHQGIATIELSPP